MILVLIQLSQIQRTVSRNQYVVRYVIDNVAKWWVGSVSNPLIQREKIHRMLPKSTGIDILEAYISQKLIKMYYITIINFRTISHANIRKKMSINYILPIMLLMCAR